MTTRKNPVNDRLIDLLKAGKQTRAVLLKALYKVTDESSPTRKESARTNLYLQIRRLRKKGYVINYSDFVTLESVI